MNNTRFGIILATFIGALGLLSPAFAFAANLGNVVAETNANNMNHDPANGVNAICEIVSAGSDVGALDSISGYMDGGPGFFAIWNMSSGFPSTMVANSDIAFTASSPGWYTETYVSQPTLSPSTDYCIGYVSTDLATNYYYSNQDNLHSGAGKTPADSTPGDLTSTILPLGVQGGGDTSFYVSYTPTGGGGGSTTPTTLSGEDILTWSALWIGTFFAVIIGMITL
jgi:hypothetical protein